MKKLAIIGKLESKHLAPYFDSTWDIWGCNLHEDMDDIPRYDLWFDVHINPSIKLQQIIPKESLILREQIHFDYYKHVLGGEYMNNSMNIMLMTAWQREYTHIVFYGCNLNSEVEHREHQKEAFNAVRMFLRGAGIKVYTIEPSLFIEYERYTK